jgi:hypothetical protein
MVLLRCYSGAIRYLGVAMAPPDTAACARVVDDGAQRDRHPPPAGHLLRLC